MQPAESKQLPAVNSRQTLQGDIEMTDIKELVTEIALVADGLHVDPKCRDVELCTRFLAAYLKEQEPVSLYPCGFKELKSLVIKHGAYLARGMNEDEPVTESIRSSAMVLVGYAKDMSDLLAKQPLFTAPPEPAPSEFSAEQRDKDWSAIKSTAPSSGEVREMVERLRDIIYVNPNDAADMIERLAARVPDDRIATLEKQRDELLVALELCKFDSLNMSLEDLGFIRSVVAKVKP